jgi:hypothetical protein
LAIKFARSPRSRIVLGLGLAALAQLLAAFLAGAGHGWVTPLFLSVILWVILPVTLYVLQQDDRRAVAVLWAVALIAIGADALLISGTIGEGRILSLYVEVNGAAGLLIIALWLTLWFFWQAMVVRALIKRSRPSDAADA